MQALASVCGWWHHSCAASGAPRLTVTVPYSRLPALSVTHPYAQDLVGRCGCDPRQVYLGNPRAKECELGTLCITHTIQQTHPNSFYLYSVGKAILFELSYLHKGSRSQLFRGIDLGARRYFSPHPPRCPDSPPSKVNLYTIKTNSL